MKVCIISGRYPTTSFDSPTNHKLYADKYGYHYIHCNWPTKTTNLYLNKVHYILNYIDLFDYIIWIDDDAFFFDFNKDIMEFAPKDGKIFSACKSPNYKDISTYLSSGQFILKSGALAKRFLNDVLAQDLHKVKEWWSDELGYFTNGDQDSMIYLLKTDYELKDQYTLYDYKDFNSRADNLFGVDAHRPLVLHFTGKEEIKEADYLKVQKELNLPPSLVEKEFTANYKIPKNKKTKNQSKPGFIKRVYRWFVG